MRLWTAAPPFRKGREEGFSLQRPYNYGLISKLSLAIEEGKNARNQNYF